MAHGNGNVDDLQNENLEPYARNEESFIHYYFYRGFNYKEIVLFLSQNHDIKMSMATFKRRLRRYRLRRQLPEYDIEEARASIQNIINGPGCLQGYRSVWHTLQLRGLRKSWIPKELKFEKLTD